MSEMIERVADALAGMHYQRHPPEAFFREAARVAIEAMREPTNEMLMASGLNGGKTNKGKYQAMIDAALKTPARLERGRK